MRNLLQAVLVVLVEKRGLEHELTRGKTGKPAVWTTPAKSPVMAVTLSVKFEQHRRVSTRWIRWCKQKMALTWTGKIRGYWWPHQEAYLKGMELSLQQHLGKHAQAWKLYHGVLREWFLIQPNSGWLEVPWQAWFCVQQYVWLDNRGEIASTNHLDLDRQKDTRRQLLSGKKIMYLQQYTGDSALRCGEWTT